MAVGADRWVGVDSGGSSTRVVVVDAAGTPIGRGTSMGANVTSHDLATIRVHLTDALREALAGVEPGSVRSACFGLAGLPGSRHRELEQFLADVVGSLGCTPRVLLRNDAEVAFAAGGTAPSGSVLIAGTGAVAAAIVDGRETATVDGHGWLLGDTGSGYWLGRRALRELMRGLDGRGPRPAFTDALLSALGVAADGDRAAMCWSVIHAVQGIDPAGVARFAASVLEVEDHDETAAMLVANGATALFESLMALRPQRGSPVVLAGSLLTNETSLSRRLVRSLGDAGHHHVALAIDGALGAARIAQAEDGVGPRT